MEVTLRILISPNILILNKSILLSYSNNLLCWPGNSLFLFWNFCLEITLKKKHREISPLHHKTCNCHTQSVILVNFGAVYTFIYTNKLIHSSSILKNNKELIDIESLAPMHS